MQKGMQVEHLMYGLGTIKEILGGKAVVNFVGEDIDIDTSELTICGTYEPEVCDESTKSNPDQIAFRRAFEAVNLGVVPPDPATLIAMTIGGNRTAAQISEWLDNARTRGLCKVLLGDYGTGKSHYLRLVRAAALRAGWAVSYLEFDPKAADPAKPHLVYREIMSNLRLPQREDGSLADGFMGLIGESRRKWDTIRDIRLLNKDPWFRNGLETLLFYPHNEDQDYLDACGWLCGQAVALNTIRKLAKEQGIPGSKIPTMPRVKETAEIYVLHLTVVSEICEALGYNGLLIILDEAEHVRGYNVRRRERANNFFDYLSRTAHVPLDLPDSPIPNEHGWELPKYWKTGPHFGLLVGLTEGGIFEDPTISLRDACVFLHDESDAVRLAPPSADDYEEWCLRLFEQFHRYHPEATYVLSEESFRRDLAKALRESFEAIEENERILRTWVKLASLVPSVLLAQKVSMVEELLTIVRKAAQEASGYALPWE